MQCVSVMHGYTLVLVLCSRILSVESEEMFCIYLLRIINIKGGSNPTFPCDFLSGLSTYFIVESGMLKYPTFIVLQSISSLRSVSIC